MNNLPDLLNEEKCRVIGLYNPNAALEGRIRFAPNKIKSHEEFAIDQSLYLNRTLKEGWFGFKIIFLNTPALINKPTIFPSSDMFGPIPHEFHKQFKENLMSSIDLPGYQFYWSLD
ncbi:MAG: hypothetical protein NT030_03205 [Candidatus Saganbacteria bacterium]|nr:hypothetical protein [Candidatus Saganbacteria bacterium]